MKSRSLLAAQNKKPESICLDAGADEKLHFFVIGSFPSGRPSRFQLNPNSRLICRDVAPAAIGFLPVGAKGRSLRCQCTPSPGMLQFQHTAPHPPEACT